MFPNNENVIPVENNDNGTESNVNESEFWEVLFKKVQLCGWGLGLENKHKQGILITFILVASRNNKNNIYIYIFYEQCNIYPTYWHT